MCLAYLDRFRDRAQAVVQHPSFRRIFNQRASAHLFELLAEPGIKFRAQLIASAIRHGGSRSCPGNNRLYLNLGHTGLNKNGFVEWTRRAGVRPVYLIHDLIPITHPQYCRAGERDRHIKRMRAALATAAGIIGNSQATLEALREFGAGEGLPHPPEVAALLGSTPLPRPPLVPVSTKPTFVVLGTIEARKNHLLLLNIWERLVARLGEAAPRLIIVGQRGWEAEEVCAVLDRGQLRDHVVEIGGASDDEVAFHLSGAQALLFPTLAEGYGLPLVEALNLDVPVIASDLPVFREIGKDIPTYLNPLDAAGWEKAVLDYADNASQSRAAQLVRMQEFQAPTWAAHFASVEAWLPKLWP